MSTRVIAFHYTLKNKVGQLIDSSEGQEPMHYLEGSQGIIPGLIPALTAMKAGEEKDVVVAPADAYGERDDRMQVKVPLEQLPKKDVKVGDHFQVSFADDERVVIVSEVGETEVTLDANHPLAGEELHFHIKIADIRDATLEEIKHGHAHGPGGHHHH
jgi:FKBP-type peptidyl-prolyl cis-trans isomerase SlyD